MNKTTIAQQAKTASLKPPAQSSLQRKCACGNYMVAGSKCAECAKKKSGLQRKLTIGASNDPLEQEADQVADQVLAAPAHSTVSAVPPRIQRFTGQATEGMDTAPASVDRVLASSGWPLEPALQQDMGQRFGHDFSRVRVHSGAAAEQSARDVNANAYTVGHNIVFGAGQFAPGTHGGRRLIAHELTHVVQQTDAERGRVSQRLARQKASEATKSKSSIILTITQQSGKTVLAVNDVAIAETDVPPGEIAFYSNWTPENLDIVIVFPEGRAVFPILGSSTNTALLKLSSHFSLILKKKLKVPERTFNELEGGFGPLKEFDTVETITGQRPKVVPAKNAPVPPQRPPQAAPAQASSKPEASATTTSTPSVQILTLPPISLDLPSASKYGKPKTEKEIAQERIDKIIRDAIAGRSDVPPLPKDMEPKSLVDTIKQGVAEAVKPLIKDLPKTAREFILDKLDSAVEKGITGIADAALDTSKLDSDTKAAIKKAIEAGIKLKPNQPGSAQK